MRLLLSLIIKSVFFLILLLFNPANISAQYYDYVYYDSYYDSYYPYYDYSYAAPYYDSSYDYTYYYDSYYDYSYAAPKEPYVEPYGTPSYGTPTYGTPYATPPTPNCTNTPINCDTCSAPPNTCGTNNGTQGCTLTGPSPCTQVLTKQSCTTSNCSSGYNCSSGTCVPNVIAPTVDIKVNKSDEPVTIDNGGSISISWTTTNSPTSCSASDSWSGPKSTSGGSESTSALSGPNTYTYTISCSNAAGSESDLVIVNVSAPAIPINTQASYKLYNLIDAQLMQILQFILWGGI